MKTVTRLFDTSKPSSITFDLIMLAYRFLVAFALIRTHGLEKIKDIHSAIEDIPDPFGFGERITSIIAITDDLVCAAFVALGFLTRLSALFILGVTVTGLLIVHFNDPWPQKDVPLMYSISFLLIIFLGAGKYSMDRLIENYFILKIQ